MATTPITPIPNPTPVATTQPAPVDTSTAQSTPQVAAPASATTPTPSTNMIAATPANSPAITPDTDTDEGLTAHTQLSLEQAPYALRKWLDIPNIQATKQAIPDDAEDYTGGRLPQSGVKSGDTKNVGVYNGHNYVHDQDGQTSAQFPVHESMHMVQNMLPKSFTDKFPKEDPKDPYKDLKLTADDLIKMRKSGDTLWNHSREGQASLMQKYTARHEWLTKKATPQEAHDYMTSSGDFKGNGNAKFEQAYAPYLDDLANAPVPKGDSGVQVNSTPMASPQVNTSYAVQAVSGHPAMDGQLPGSSEQSSASGLQAGDTVDTTPYSPSATGGLQAGDTVDTTPVPSSQDPGIFKDATDALNNVGAGIGEGLLSSVNGAADMLHLPHTTLEARQKELETNNAQNPDERAIGYGGETLAEFMSGDEALKGLTLSKRLMATSKVLDLVEQYPRLANALKLGAGALKAGTELSPEELELVRTHPVIAKLVGLGVNAARVGTVQGAQTAVRTPGTIGDRAESGVVAGLEGAGAAGVTEGVLSGAGALVSKLGDAGEKAGNLAQNAAASPDKPQIANDIQAKLVQSKENLHNNYDAKIKDFEHRLEGTSTPVVGNPLSEEAKARLVKPDPEDHPTVQKADEVLGNGMNGDTKDFLDLLASGQRPLTKDELAAWKAEQVDAKPLYDADDKLIPNSAEPPKGVDLDPYNATDLIKLRQKIRGMAAEHPYGDTNARALRSLLWNPVTGTSPFDDTFAKLADQSDDPDVVGEYGALRNDYRNKIGRYDNPVIKNLMEGKPDDAAKAFIGFNNASGKPNTGNTEFNTDNLRELIGNDGLQKFSGDVLGNMMKMSSDEHGFNPAQFNDLLGQVTKGTKEGFFGSSDPQSAINQIASDTKTAANVQKLTRAGVLGASVGAAGLAEKTVGTGPVYLGLGSILALLMKSKAGEGGIAAGRDMIDYVANHPRTWAFYRQLGKIPTSKVGAGAATAIKAGVNAATDINSDLQATDKQQQASSVSATNRRAIKNAYRGAAGALGATH